MSLPPVRSADTVLPPELPGGGGATPPAWYHPPAAVLEGATFTDPSDQVEEPVTYAGPGRINLVTQNEGIATYAPFAGPAWVFDAKGLDGADVEVIAGDVMRAYAQPGGNYVDIVVWAGMFNSSNNHGFAGGVAWNAASAAYETVRSTNTGAGWGAPVDATGTPSALTVGGLAAADAGNNGGVSVGVTTSIVGASEDVPSAATSSVTRAASNLTGPFDKFFVGFGFRTGTGGAAGGTVQLGCAFAAFPTVGVSPFV